MSTVIAGLSTIVPIGVAANWTSAWVDNTSYSIGFITARTDTGATLTVEQSIDGIIADIAFVHNISASGPGVIVTPILITCQYMRLTVTNLDSPTPQNTTRVQTILMII